MTSQELASPLSDEAIASILERDCGIYVSRRLMDWLPHGADSASGPAHLPRRALINTFGAGGSCVSMVVEEYASPEPDRDEEARLKGREEAILLSAHTAEQLRAITEQFLGYARRNPDTPLGDLADILQLRRTHMRYRWAAIVRTIDELIEKLRDALEQEVLDHGVGYSSQDSFDTASRLKRIISGNLARKVSENLMENRDLAGLAGLWQMGIDVPWAQVSGERRVARLSLPSYPFARKSLSFA
ncbi:MAG: hypothetical protein M0Z78_05540 [Betaproteobacteria bacterium]|nr:hypothetical protein [Betaproteobacteria bacterium]